MSVFQGKYDEATKYFDKAYNLSRSMGETAAINVNRVQFGVAMAHKMMQGVGGHIVLNNLPALERLIEWKSSRVDEFEKPFPEPSMYCFNVLSNRELKNIKNNILRIMFMLS